MLPKTNRVKKKNDFAAAFRGGKVFKSDILSIRVKPNNKKISRFGFVISKKISPKAVVRNRIRRQLSEIVKLEMGSIKIEADIVFVGFPGIENKTFVEIKESVKKLLSNV